MFDRVIDKSIIPTVNIMGANIAAIDMDWLLDFTTNHINDMSGDYICVANVHTTVMCYEDEAYRDVQNSALMSIPDGGPLSTLGRKRTSLKMRRTTGPDYLERILDLSSEYKWKHYFYGSTQETLDLLRERLMRSYPGIQIGGMYSPPFRDLSIEEDKSICEDINNSAPDFVWIGLGAPKQEMWMASHQGRIKGVMIGVGAAFDYFAGNIKRAPLWAQRANLEWLYRLIQEPKRLFKRYFVTNSKFVWNAIIRGR